MMGSPFERTTMMMPRYLLLVLSVLVALSCADDVVPEAGSLRTGRTENDVAPQEHRQLMGWWFSLLFQSLGDGCLPGPMGDHCRKQKIWERCQGGLEAGDENYEFCQESMAENYEDNGDGAVYSTNNDGASNTSPDSTSGGGAAKIAWWMIIVAAVATLFAIGAIIMGQRKKRTDAHPLHGSVARRMNLFSEFADATLCASNKRPARVVEMTMSKDDHAMA